MDVQPQQSISDDQELAKVLAGITNGANGAAGAPADLADGINEEANTLGEDAKEDNKADVPDLPTPTEPPANPSEPTNAPTPTPATPADEPVAPVQPPVQAPSPKAPAAAGSLDAIKHDALNELRPLVDKLNISAEEKFDTYLLIIRSTDDSSLVAPAFEAARAIADEAGKAQALLEIVKEIDYLSNPQKQPA